jgi:hypothetical protein
MVSTGHQDGCLYVSTNGLCFRGGNGLILPASIYIDKMKKLFCLVSLCLLFHIHSASALTFNVTYDSSVTSATNAAQIQSAFAVVTQSFQDIITNNVTVKITVYWGPTGPFSGGISLARSQFSLIDSSYSEITNALRLHRASAADSNSVASLPATDPVGSGTTWLVPFAQARVLGLVAANDPFEDGQVGFAADKNYTFDPNNRTVAGKFDFIGVAQHEVSEVLGRASASLDPSFGFVPYDLFRFTSNGVRSFDPNATNAYFSVDNGATVLKFFYTNQFFGDIQDWKSSATPDAFDAFSSSGHLLPMSTVDITAMDVLGYNGPRLAPPRLFITNSVSGSIVLRFVNSPGTTWNILGTTNLALPLASWTALGTATEISTGQFQLSDAAAATGTRRFYVVRSP